MENFKRQGIISAIMRNLKDVRKIEDIQTFSEVVTFRLRGKIYLVTGEYPELRVEWQNHFVPDLTAQLNFVPARKKRQPLSTTPLRKAREARGETLKQIAADIGIDTSNLSRIERGLQVASYQIAEKLCAYFDNSLTVFQICYPDKKVSMSKSV